MLAHQMAMESPLVQAEMIEAQEFMDLSMKYSVSGVPHTVINEGAAELVGAGPEHYLIDRIKEALGASCRAAFKAAGDYAKSTCR
jgi:predicted DsbA family dithiol-disulfide isomerase